ncbi:hypothetical protein C4D60_Mb04t04900 [Musa balbisiana]|uniref:Uncharacterized protein n=1 Tax=Musa balbisiana TaxID=52838 RepID=A0A4S8K9Q2_MUSBA|nr:hypothetical protein C4D60_Mb04t04900 [Musa balbisiana]
MDDTSDKNENKRWLAICTPFTCCVIHTYDNNTYINDWGGEQSSKLRCPHSTPCAIPSPPIAEDQHLKDTITADICPLFFSSPSLNAERRTLTADPLAYSFLASFLGRVERLLLRWTCSNCLGDSGKMATAELIMNASIVPVSELISRAVQAAYDTIRAARDVLVERHGFTELAAYLDRVVPILDQLKATTPAANRDGSSPLADAAGILAREVEAARALALDCGKRNRISLLLNCRRIVTRLESATREIGRAISLLPLASLDLSSAIRDEAKLLSDSMVRAEFRAAAAEEEILRKVESAIQEHNSDRSCANSLLALIADAVGISKDRTVLKKEFAEFKEEVVEAKLRKDLAEAIQMDQIIALLSRADATSSFKEKEVKYYSKRNSLGWGASHWSPSSPSTPHHP